MNIEQREMASEVVTTYAQELSEHFDEINADLRSALSGSSEATSPAEAIANRTLLSDLVRLLPRQSENHDIHTEDVARFRWLQSTTVWIGDIDFLDRRGFHFKPHYFIGLKALPRNKLGLLLHEPHATKESHASLKEVRVPRRDFDKARARADAIPLEQLSEEELNEASTGSGLSLRNSINRIPLRLLIPRSSNSFHNLPNFCYLPMNVFTSAVGIKPKVINHNIRALSDETLASYDAFRYIGHLLTVFGKVKEGNALTAGENLQTMKKAPA
jgi:hypothetical protein